MHDDLDLRDFDGLCRLFPLPGVVLFPHAVLPLHIFEPRYRQMTQDALASDKLIAMVQVRPDADWSGQAEPAIEEFACLGKILNHERLPDGRFNFLLVGLKRIRLVREIPGGKLYRRAEAEIVDDEGPYEPSESARADLIAGFRAVAGRSGPIDPDLDALIGSGLPLGPLTDIIAHSLGLPAPLKQAMLAEARVDRRAGGLIEILHQLVDPPRRPFPPPFSRN